MSRGSRADEEFKELPVCAIDYVGRVARMIGYRRKVRREVQTELLGYFADALRDRALPEERQARAERLVVEFGDPHLVAILCRRAKKRCRPPWRKAVDAARLAVFLLVAVAGSYTAWFVSGKPVVTDAYLRKLNQLGPAQLAPEDNAWPHYERAAALFVEAEGELKAISAFPSQGRLTLQSMAQIGENRRKDLIAWLAANEPAWAHYETASRCSGYHKTYRYDRSQKTLPCLIEIITYPPMLAHLRDLSEVGIWKSRLAAEEGRLDDAIDACLAIARAGTHFQSAVCVVDQVMGMGLGATARLELLRIVAEHGFSAAALGRVQDTLAQLYPAEYPLADFEGHRLEVLDAVQHSFTQGGLGGGHMIPGQYAVILEHTAIPQGAQATGWTRAIFRVIDVGLCLTHVRRNKTVARINELHDEISRRSRLSPYQRHVSGTRELVDSVCWYRYGFAFMLLPAECRVSELAFRSRAGHEATLTILALKRYRVEKGMYPADLKSLVDAAYLDDVPMDPYSDGPLIYRCVGDAFLLYSVGPDFVDGEGTPGVDHEGQPKAWADHGDMVFWPPGRSLATAD